MSFNLSDRLGGQLPYEGPTWGLFYELRFTRGDVVILSLLPRSGI